MGKWLFSVCQMHTILTTKKQDLFVDKSSLHFSLRVD